MSSTTVTRKRSIKDVKQSSNVAPASTKKTKSSNTVTEDFPALTLKKKKKTPTVKSEKPSDVATKAPSSTKNTKSSSTTVTEDFPVQISKKKTTTVKSEKPSDVATKAPASTRKTKSTSTTVTEDLPGEIIKKDTKNSTIGAEKPSNVETKKRVSARKTKSTFASVKKDLAVQIMKKDTKNSTIGAEKPSNVETKKRVSARKTKSTSTTVTEDLPGEIIKKDTKNSTIGAEKPSNVETKKRVSARKTKSTFASVKKDLAVQIMKKDTKNSTIGAEKPSDVATKAPASTRKTKSTSTTVTEDLPGEIIKKDTKNSTIGAEKPSNVETKKRVSVRKTKSTSTTVTQDLPGEIIKKDTKNSTIGAEKPSNVETKKRVLARKTKSTFASVKKDLAVQIIKKDTKNSTIGAEKPSNVETKKRVTKKNKTKTQIVKSREPSTVATQVQVSTSKTKSTSTPVQKKTKTNFLLPSPTEKKSKVDISKKALRKFAAPPNVATGFASYIFKEKTKTNTSLKKYQPSTSSMVLAQNKSKGKISTVLKDEARKHTAPTTVSGSVCVTNLIEKVKAQLRSIEKYKQLSASEVAPDKNKETKVETSNTKKNKKAATNIVTATTERLSTLNSKVKTKTVTSKKELQSECPSKSFKNISTKSTTESSTQSNVIENRKPFKRRNSNVKETDEKKGNVIKTRSKSKISTDNTKNKTNNRKLKVKTKKLLIRISPLSLFRMPLQQNVMIKKQTGSAKRKSKFTSANQSKKMKQDSETLKKENVKENTNSDDDDDDDDDDEDSDDNENYSPFDSSCDDDEDDDDDHGLGVRCDRTTNSTKKKASNSSRNSIQGARGSSSGVKYANLCVDSCGESWLEISINSAEENEKIEDYVDDEINSAYNIDNNFNLSTKLFNNMEENDDSVFIPQLSSSLDNKNISLLSPSLFNENDDEENSIEDDDEVNELEDDDEENSTEDDDEENEIENDDEVNELEDDDEENEIENDDEVNELEDDEEESELGDNDEENEIENDDEVNELEDDDEENSIEDDDEENEIENDDEVNELEDDNEESELGDDDEENEIENDDKVNELEDDDEESELGDNDEENEIENEDEENINEIEEEEEQMENDEKIYENLKFKTKFYDSIDSRYVLVHLKDTIILQGTIKLKLITGSIEIFGYKPKINEQLEIFSPRGYSNLLINPIKNNKLQLSKNHDDVDVVEYLSSIIKNSELLNEFHDNLLFNNIENILKNFNIYEDALILLERNERKEIEMINNYMRENMFLDITNIIQKRSLNSSEIILKCILGCENNKKIEYINDGNIDDNDENDDKIKISDKWDNIEIKSDSKLMIIGGKNVGKSTLLRYLINKNLENHKSFLLIDIDIGQSEIFIPQTISVTLINKPLLGPGYLYSLKPLKSYLYGDTNIVQSPKSYLLIVKKLINYCYNISNNDYNNIPWLINTMGYNKGFGSELISIIIDYLKPTDIIQIEDKYKFMNNYDYHMSSDIIKNIPKYLFADEISNNNNKIDEKLSNNHHDHQLILLDSVVPNFNDKNLIKRKNHNNNVPEITARDKRYEMMIAHCGRILYENNDEWLTDVHPYIVAIDKLNIISLEDKFISKTDILNVINGNFVYLCGDADDDGCFECFGLGIVRAVNDVENTILILPSTTEEILKCSVTTLVECKIPLQASVLLNQGPKVNDIAPYIYTTKNFIATRHIHPIYYRPNIKKFT